MADKLPNECLTKICSYLDFTDLLNCCLTCKRLRDAAEDNQVWKGHCRRIWNVTQCPSHMSWKENFATFYKDYGRYRDIYARVRKAWDDIEDFTEEHVPHIFESLQDGLSEAELNALESKLGVRLPNSLRCIYRIHNGQAPNMAAGFGLLGSMQVYNVYITVLLADIKDSVSMVSASEEQCPLRTVLEIARCYHSDVTYHVVLTEEDGMIQGQVHCPARKNVGFLGYPMDPNAVEMLNRDRVNFIVGNDFLDWFTSYAAQLAQNRYPVVNNQILSFLDDPTCVEWTGNICVKVSTRFCPEQSSLYPSPDFFHVYYIHMSMHEDAPEGESCKLLTRHWIITNEEGLEERVDGPGVIGEYPVMRPGAVFAYCSCTSFSTTYGNMGGHFTFQRFNTGAQVQIKCPTFHMKCLPYETYDDRKARLLELKKSN